MIQFRIRWRNVFKMLHVSVVRVVEAALRSTNSGWWRYVAVLSYDSGFDRARLSCSVEMC